MTGSRCIAESTERIGCAVCRESGSAWLRVTLRVVGAKKLRESFASSNEAGLDARERASLHVAYILEGEPGELEKNDRLSLRSGKPAERSMEHCGLGCRIGRRTGMRDLAGSLLVILSKELPSPEAASVTADGDRQEEREKRLLIADRIESFESGEHRLAHQIIRILGSACHRPRESKKSIAYREEKLHEAGLSLLVLTACRLGHEVGKSFCLKEAFG
jgi:hypothetical protein